MLFWACNPAAEENTRPDLTRSYRKADSLAAQRLLDRMHIDSILKKQQLDSVLTDSLPPDK